MRRSKFFLVFLLAALLLAGVRSAEDDDPYQDPPEDVKEEIDTSPYVDETNVIILSDSNATDVLQKYKQALVMFYTLDDIYKDFKPELAKAADALKGSHPGVLVAKVNALKGKETLERYGVTEVLSVLWLESSEKVAELPDDAEPEKILEWAERMASPSTIVPGLRILAKYQAERTPFLLGYFSEFRGPLHDEFEAVARRNEKLLFLKTGNPKVAAQMGIRKAPGFVLGRNYSEFDFEAIPAEGHPTFEGEGSLQDKLAALMHVERLPLYLEYKQSNYDDIFRGGVSKQLVIVAPNDELAAGSALHSAILDIAKAFKGKLVFVICKQETSAGVANPEVRVITTFFGVPDEGPEYTMIFGYDTATKDKYVLKDESFTLDQFKAFAQGVVDGTADKHYKSAPLPQQATDYDVTVIVGSTVDTIAKDPTKDVAVLVYAPWCQHSAKMQPAYIQLAKRFANVDSVVIAQMDGSANDHPVLHEVKHRGFPTLFFFPAEADAKPIIYTGDRSLLDMTRFIKQHAQIPFTLPKKKRKGKGKLAVGGDKGGGATSHEEL